MFWDHDKVARIGMGIDIHERIREVEKIAKKNEQGHNKAMVANERQVGGDHYKTGGAEHWDMVNQFGLDYFQGQITKYLFRWRKKNGVEDLEKARHYLDKYIELAKGEEQIKTDAAVARAFNKVQGS